MTEPPQPPEPTAEDFPLWGLVVVLGEIAERACRRQAVEPGTDALDAGDSRLDEPEEAAA
jgi:hypothetical protein